MVVGADEGKGAKETVAHEVGANHLTPNPFRSLPLALALHPDPDPRP